MPGRRSARTSPRPGASLSGPSDLVLAGRALVHGELRPLEIGIGADGRIERIGRSLRGARRHDVGERVILPAAVDLHVHFREPGGSREVEGWESGSLQAALGGVGLVGEMPNTLPPVDSADRVEGKAARARGRLAVDAFLFGLARRPAEVLALAPLVAAFKLYMSPTTGVDSPPEDGELAELLEAVARRGRPLTVHAESEGGFRTGDDAPLRDTADWSSARPARAEAEAIGRLLGAAPSGMRLSVAHLTTDGAARLLHGRWVAGEVTPHHLLLSARRDGPATEKVNPPLRSESDRASLWEAFRSGRIPFLASDHAPHAASEKARPFASAPSGMPGIETMLPLLLEKVRAAELPLATLLDAAADRPARWMGAPMGRIAVGHRAHLVVVDFRRRERLTAGRLHAPCGWSAFEGWEAIRPVEHYHDGRPIVLDGEYVGAREGRLLAAPPEAGAPSLGDRP